MPHSPEIIAIVAPSPLRRAFGISALAALGGICLWIALGVPPEDPVWHIVLLVIGGGALWLADRLRRATADRIELTAGGLRETGGRVLAPLDRIVSVESGVFAFKPSSGFLIRLDRAAPRAWAPGLWWRLGRRVGVGGVTAGHQARYMAEAIAVLLAERDGRQE